MTLDFPTLHKPTALLLLRDGTKIWGHGHGAEGFLVGEVCFNTAMTGYQEVMTDPSYAGQIILFTFPHIGNTGTNPQDSEIPNTARPPLLSGVIMREEISPPSNYRATSSLGDWLKDNGVVAMSGVDTRALTTRLRQQGFFDAVIAHNSQGVFDTTAMAEKLTPWKGLANSNLVFDTTTDKAYQGETPPQSLEEAAPLQGHKKHHVVALDFGIKRTIIHCLRRLACKVTVVPATTSAEDILAQNPDGIFLSNGPGDPEAFACAEGGRMVQTLKKLITSGVPMFGICLGHQVLAVALGGKTEKMHQGHHGANHPVKDLTTGKVEIVSMNHGFAVQSASLPQSVQQTHVSLFDGSNCGLQVKGKPVFSVQYHPEASPGPQDSQYLFTKFTQYMAKK